MRHACWPAPLLTSLLLVSGVTVGCATTKAGPTIDSLSPSSGPVGTSLTIKGNYFQATQGTSTVTFNGVQASATSWSAKKIVATAPGATTTGPVVVNVSGVPSNSDKIFTVSGLTPDFTLSVSPLSHTVVQCGPTGYCVMLASLSGFISAVT